MRWTDDIGSGAWIEPRLRGWGRVGGVIPRGFEAYARIFHPVPVDRRDDAGEWRQSTWTWAELAARQGLVMHPLVQSSRLDELDGGAEFPDGWRTGQLVDGFLPPERLAALVPALRGATGSPDDIRLGIWDGWGQLSSGGSSVFLIAGTSAAERDALNARLQAERALSVSPEVAAAVGQRRDGRSFGPLLHLPGRDYVLLAGSLDELADATWPRRAGIGWMEQFEGPMPQLVWPQDHAWCVASEIDFDSTLVGGSRVLIDAVLASPAVEALEVGEDDDLSSTGDTINVDVS